MYRISGAFSQAYLEYALVSGYDMIACSFFDRSNQTVKSVASAVTGGGTVSLISEAKRERRVNAGWGKGADSYIAPLRLGKERVSHALCVSKYVNTEGVLTTKERMYADVYNFLMATFTLPLLPEWIPSILERVYNPHATRLEIVTSIDNQDLFFPLGNKKENVKDLIWIPLKFREEYLEKVITELFSEGKICISPNKQNPLKFENMDEYFQIYGSGIMDNLTKLLHPVSEHSDKMEYEALKGLRLYPQQISVDNGVINYFRKKKGRYALFNCGMGTGKTIMGATAVDGYFNSLAMDKGKSLKEVLCDKDAVKYRNIVMCPPHLVEKWVKEINSQIPHAKAIAITDFKQLLEIKANGRERTSKEWYVMSKDFGKLSYMEVPAVRSIKKARVGICRCSECETPKGMTYRGNACTREGCEGHFEFAETEMLAVGFTCPSCGHLLSTPPRKDGDSMKSYLGHFDFVEKNKWNEKCWFCDEPLWQPYVRNLGPQTKKRSWHRVTHYANKARKAKKTVWLLSGTENKYFSQLGMEMLNDLGNEGGVRKYAPALYIKKQLKGFFDFALFDEVHQYKGGATAQGNAMHALIKASKYQLGLTGTIAGGVATHLFFLLFRLDPGRMKARGFEFSSETAFAEQYGTIETVFEAVESRRSNKMSKGRQLQSPKVKPGISPKVFTDFLMDRAVFLDLSDMSKFLPPLKEKVVITETEPEILQEYTRVVDKLKEEAKDTGGGGLLGSMLQFSLSYTDKPYGVGPIIHPVTGKDVVKPFDLSHLIDGRLLNKERELVNIINIELSEGRNCVVFAEYTNSEETCVTERLKEIIEEHCNLHGKVQIIKASTPEAIKREAWLHEKASEGIKVFITNPKILETGVDLCFSHNGVFHNYPTLLFFQLSYSLFSIWQASRRHYRLCQKEECRTYYMASNGTVQPAVIKLVAAKQVATSAIQGKFSAEGLAALAEGVDARLVLAKALADKDVAHQDELQNMFDVLADTTDDSNSEYVPMATYYEVVGEDEPKDILPEIFIPDLMMFDMDEEKGEPKCSEDEFNMFMFNLFDIEVNVPKLDSKPKVEPKSEPEVDYSEKVKVKGSANSMSLFELLF